MKFPGNEWFVVLVGLLGLLGGIQSLEAATYLGQSTEVRTPSSKVDSYTPYTSSDDDDDDDDVSSAGSSRILAFLSPEEAPDDWVPGRFRASAEFGYQHWMPSSSSGQYDASYDIDPVSTTLLETSVRVKHWFYSLDYTTSLSDPEQVRNLLAQVSRMDPGQGAWWTLYAESGAVEGHASTVDEFGQPVVYPVDTVWHRIGIDWRTYQGTSAGLVFEDLTMPTILTVNNEQIAFAFFDEKTRARTLSLSLGYDRARRLHNAFKEGGAWAWTVQGSLGFGWLSYSEEQVREVIEAQGYNFESSEVLLTGAIDGRLGYTYSKELWGSKMQCFVGGACGPQAGPT